MFTERIKTIMKKYIILLITALLGFGTGFAKEQSIAYVDMAYILRNLPQYEQANEQLTMLSKRWQKEIEAAQQEARVLATNYQTEQIFLSEAMRREREEEIVRKAQAEAAAILDKAALDADREKDRAIGEARGEIAEMAFSIAEKVVGRELNDSDQSALVDQFIDGLGDKP